MNELTPCLEEANAATGQCSKFTQELHDIKAFHNLLGAFASGSLPASALLVAFHNLVTESISSSFNGKRRHFYCWQDAVAKLQRSLVRDGANHEMPSIDAPTHALFDGVLGLGHHELQDCS
mmetsp:Transcript_55163/g.131457  ORF Transcript_55163/g.131457 Transcript_55163/m.131457 type:complete len:121 (-) Transcript_55163:226-588(-)